jgi:glucose/arabinose dehydrogenase
MRRLSAVLMTVVLSACMAGPNGTTVNPSTSTAQTTSPTSTTPETTGRQGTPATTPPSTTVAPSTTTSTIAVSDTVLAYEPIADMAFPVQVTARRGDPVSYVITKDGRVFMLQDGVVSDRPVMDITGEVTNSGERGLLSIALHPTDPTRFYLHYSDRHGDTVVSEFTLTAPDTADPATERILLQVDQPASNHNGGLLLFMPDGRLLLGLGDGGGSGDRYRNAQNQDTLLGGLTAMSVDGDPNPELFAFGLRNPWRYWIDAETLYIADVGQDAHEEIDVTPLEADLNFGWPITEGLHCYRPSSGCEDTGLVAPVLEIDHGDAGTCSITGGIVYRGGVMPQLDGRYFFSDYCGGYLRSFQYSAVEDVSVTDWTDQVGVPGQVTGFGIDGSGEMYLTTTDQLLKLVPAG